MEICKVPASEPQLPLSGGSCNCDASIVCVGAGASALGPRACCTAAGFGTCDANVTCVAPGTDGLLGPRACCTGVGTGSCTGGVSSGTCTAGASCANDAACGLSANGEPGACANNYMMLINQPARTFQPPAVIPVVPAVTLCIDSIRSEGWCDCVGTGVPSDPSLCLDHDGSTPGPNDDCGVPSTDATFEEGCLCGFPPGPSCGGAGCLACVRSNGARCHSGTKNGPLAQTWTGASIAGTCVDLNTIQFKLLPPAICVTAGGAAVGQCAAPGPADPPCALLGGAVCLSSIGADGRACTMDDLVPASAPSTVPFTTGTSLSAIGDFLAVQGVCVAGNAGMNCMTNSDCDTPSGAANGACGGAIILPGLTGFGAGPGAAISCPALESSNVAGWSIVGSFPSLDGAGGLGDLITTFTISCS